MFCEILCGAAVGNQILLSFLEKTVDALGVSSWVKACFDA